MNSDTDPVKKRSWFSYFFDCLFAGIALILSLFFISSTFFRENYIAYGIAFLCVYGAVFIAMLGFSVYWYAAEKCNRLNFPKLHIWLRGLVRYGLAYTISVYGFAKIFKTQFSLPHYYNDVAFGKLTGFELTWNYFGYSYKLAVILALFQIGGAVFLLFRRTTLLGCCILLPVMANIVLINIFYEISQGAFIVSLLITAGLTYLLLLKWPELKKLFIDADKNALKIKYSQMLLSVKLLVITLAFFSIYKFIMHQERVEITGKWKVMQLKKNGIYVKENDWLSDDKAWQYIYIEEMSHLAISSNPYVFDTEKAKKATFKYDSKKKTISIFFSNQGVPIDTMQAVVTRTAADAMTWRTVYNSDTIVIDIVREKYIKPIRKMQR